MSRLPGYRRLNEQDFPAESQELVRQLSSTLNYGVEVLYDLLNGKLTFADNLDSLIKDFNVEVDSNGVPLIKVTLKKKNTNRIEGLAVIRVDNLTNPSVFPTSGVTLSFTETTDSIIINHITGLPISNIFNIKIVTIR